MDFYPVSNHRGLPCLPSAVRAARNLDLHSLISRTTAKELNALRCLPRMSSWPNNDFVYSTVLVKLSTLVIVNFRVRDKCVPAGSL